MKYEIITDIDDLLVLTVNSRVITISYEMSEIMRILDKDYTDSRNKVKRVYEKAVIHPELDIDEYKATELPIVPIKKDEEGATLALGKLFKLWW